MRRCQYTITRRAVHAHAEQVCQRHVRLRDTGRKCKAKVLWAVLFWAASRISSLAAAWAGLRPRYLLLDKGFCSVAVIRYLQRARWGWLMPLVTRGRRPGHPRGASGSQVFRTCRRGGWAQYTMTAKDGSRATFAVCVKCR